MKKPPRQSSLWRWLCVRILSLAIGSVVIIATCMWLRFALWSTWIAHRMPDPVKKEFALLRENPAINPIRYHEIIDTWYGQKFSDPSIATTDWLALGLLVLVAIPLILVLGLRAARPLSGQFSRIAMAARAVAQGTFSTRAGLENNAPAELVILTQDFNAMTTQLERYDRELKASHVAMAHELRSPLTAAIGRLQGMLDGVFTPDARQLSQVMTQLNQLNRLVDDLHLLSMAQAGQLSLCPLPIDIAELVQEKIAWLKPRTAQTGFIIELQPHSPFICDVDPLRLGQVFTILMDNALQYADDGHRLDITIARQRETVVITFRDYGAGVSEDFLPQMFERFSRADSSRARHSGGSGLGLSIARAICEAHGGSLQAEHHPQRGMCFILHLPA